MNNLSPAQTERIGKISEELGEVSNEIGVVQQIIGKAQQIIGKIIIHGLHAEFEGMQWDNKADLERELGDLQAAIQIMVDAGDLDPLNIEAAKQAKLPKIRRYMKHQNNVV